MPRISSVAAIWLSFPLAAAYCTRRRCSGSPCSGIWPLRAQRISSLAGIRVRGQERGRGQHHPRRAEAALEPVLLVEALLHRAEPAGGREALDGGELVPVGLDGEHRARLHRRPSRHRAGAAVGRVAADVRPGKPERLAEEVHEQEPRLDLDERGAGDRHGDRICVAPVSTAVSVIVGSSTRTPSRRPSGALALREDADDAPLVVGAPVGRSAAARPRRRARPPP